MTAGYVIQDWDLVVCVGCRLKVELVGMIQYSTVQDSSCRREGLQHNEER